MRLLFPPRTSSTAAQDLSQVLVLSGDGKLAFTPAGRQRYETLFARAGIRLSDMRTIAEFRQALAAMAIEAAQRMVRPHSVSGPAMAHKNVWRFSPRSAASRMTGLTEQTEASVPWNVVAFRQRPRS